jgi:predicted nucleic acid-binding protein
VTPRLAFDTGALIALERGHHGIRKVVRVAFEIATPIVVTTPVLAEWWREGKREKERAEILRSLLIEPPDAHVAKLAGCAVGLVGAGVVDALVMAAASIRKDIVFTSDPADMERLQEVFPDVPVERV